MWWRSRATRADRLRADVHELGRRFDEISQQNRDEIQITREVMRRNEIAFQEFRREVNDLIEESRAQRGALLSLIDEMRGDGPRPATS